MSAVAGLVLSLLIAVVHGAAALGVFNQVFACFIFASQLAVLGVHHSTLRYVAATDDDVEIRAISTAALVLAALCGSLVSLALWLLAPVAGQVLDSPGVVTGIRWASPGLVFFALNKVILAQLNARRSMILYAIFQGGRFIAMLGAFALLWALGVESDALGGVLALGEIVLFVCAIWTFPFGRRSLRPWIAAHLDFGLRGFLGGILVELNTRVDVLMLGFFCNDVVVGMYSFAAIFAEGFYQLLIVARNNYNPILVRLLEARDEEALRRLVRRALGVIYPVIIALGALAVVLFWYGLPLLSSDPDLLGSREILAILLLGVLASSGFVPFTQLLLQAGRPGWHSLMILCVVAFNVVANAVAIPIWLAHGAAAATAMATVISVLALQLLARRVLGLRL